MDIKAQLQLLKKLKSDFELIIQSERAELKNYILNLRNDIEEEIVEFFKSNNTKQKELTDEIEKKETNLLSLVDELDKLTKFCTTITQKNTAINQRVDELENIEQKFNNYKEEMAKINEANLKMLEDEKIKNSVMTKSLDEVYSKLNGVEVEMIQV